MPKQATVAQAKAALKKLDKALAASIKKDTRSAISRLVMPALMDGTNATVLKKIVKDIRASFVDWNEVRIAEPRELISVIAEAGHKHPEALAAELQLTLKDVFQQQNIVNFEFDLLDPSVCVKEEPPQDGEAPAEPTPSAREEGLPAHTTISGFVDGHRLLTETTSLPPKIVEMKNSDRVFNVVWENPTRRHARVVWAVGLSLGLVPAGLNPYEAIAALREYFSLQADQERFAALAVAHFEKATKTIEKQYSKMAKLPDEEEDTTPFAVTLGIAAAEEDDKDGKQAVLPRSVRMGRISKRATPKLAAPAKKASSGRSARSTATSKKKASKKKVTAKKKVTKKTAKKKTNTKKKARK